MARRRSTTPIELAHAIADDLASDGVHGRFTLKIEEAAAPSVPGRPEWKHLRGDYTRPEFSEWHIYQAVFKKHYDLEDLLELLGPFRQWLASYYSERTSVRVYMKIENDDGEEIENMDRTWRSLTRTRKFNAAFEQADGAAIEWTGNATSAKYVSMRGVAVHCEVGSNYQNGRLYLT